jgi:N6-adenosine-specific RNA methylase IME4
MDQQLEQLNAARQMLVKAQTVPEVRKAVDFAEAFRIIAKKSNAGLEILNRGAELKLRAERRGGQMLFNLEKRPGTRNDLTPGHRVPRLSEFADAKRAAGISDKQATRWQRLGDLTDEEFERHVAEIKARMDELNTAFFLRLAREVTHRERQTVDPPTGRFRVIYADPPWSYGNANLQGYGHASFHYPSMSIEELCTLPVRDLADENAVLFLWVTSPLVMECLPVINAWDFEYKASFVWDKVKHNFGHYNSVRHEFLLVCTRGRCTPDVNQLFDSVQAVERGEHSEKPEEFRKIIDTLYCHGKRIELFARRPAGEEWAIWGNEKTAERGRAARAKHRDPFCRSITPNDSKRV